MEINAIVKSVSNARSLNGRNGELKMVDVVVSNGLDEFVTTAFDKVAEMFEKQSVKAGMYCVCRLRASIREHDGKQFQSISLDAVAPIIDPNKVF